MLIMPQANSLLHIFEFQIHRVETVFKNNVSFLWIITSHEILTLDYGGENERKFCFGTPTSLGVLIRYTISFAEKTKAERRGKGREGTLTSVLTGDEIDVVDEIDGHAAMAHEVLDVNALNGSGSFRGRTVRRRHSSHTISERGKTRSASAIFLRSF
jgi:hypothetical protein